MVYYKINTIFFKNLHFINFKNIIVGKSKWDSSKNTHVQNPRKWDSGLKIMSLDYFNIKRF